MINIIKILQIIISCCLTGLILLQSKGGGLSQTVGSSFSTYSSKRGFEKFVFIFTIILSVLLVASSLSLVIFK